MAPPALAEDPRRRAETIAALERARQVELICADAHEAAERLEKACDEYERKAAPDAG